MRWPCCTKSVCKLKNRIPIRTFYTGAERKTPGFIQVDAVHHCGSSTGGEYLITMTANDDLAMLNAVRLSLEPLLDFFMPTMKLASKIKVGSKETGKCGKPVSPCRRLMNSETLTQDVKDKLQGLCRLCNPALLQNDVNKAVTRCARLPSRSFIPNDAS